MTEEYPLYLIQNGQLAPVLSMEELEVLDNAVAFLVEEHVDESPLTVNLLGKIRAALRMLSEGAN